MPDEIGPPHHIVLVQYAASLRARGRSETEIRTALLNASRERCRPPRTSGRALKKIEGIVQWIASKPSGTGKTGVLTEAEVAALEEAYMFVHAQPWQGTVAWNAWLVASALLMLMGDVGKLTVDVGCREMSELTGLSFSTAAKALRMLCGDKRWKREEVPVLFGKHRNERVEWKRETWIAKRHSYSYTLNQKDALFAHTFEHPEQWKAGLARRRGDKEDRNSERQIVDFFSHDVFRGRGQGLPRGAARILFHLPQTTAAQLVAVTSLSLRWVNEMLAWLKAAGLVEKREGLWQATTLSLNTVAEQRGTTGAATRQRAEHARQRVTYRDVLMDPLRARKKHRHGR